MARCRDESARIRESTQVSDLLLEWMSFRQSGDVARVCGAPHVEPYPVARTNVIAHEDEPKSVYVR